MASAPAQPEYDLALRATIIWAGLSAFAAMLFALPLILGAPYVLIVEHRDALSFRNVALGTFAAVLGLILLYMVFCNTAESVVAVWRWDGYLDRHWQIIRRTLRTHLGILLVFSAAGLSLTAFAVLGDGQQANGLILFAALADALFILFQLSQPCGINYMVQHAHVVPYFDKKVGEIDTFCHGQSLARHGTALDEAARSLGVTPLSAFGWNDDMDHEKVEWHEPSEGLKTVNALLLVVQRGELAWVDQEAIAADLKRVAHALTRAEERAIQFSLLLRHEGGTSGLEWEARQGTCF